MHTNMHFLFHEFNVTFLLSCVFFFPLFLNKVIENRSCLESHVSSYPLSRVKHETLGDIIYIHTHTGRGRERKKGQNDVYSQVNFCKIAALSGVPH